MKKNTRQRIRAIYQQNPRASRLQILQALGRSRPTPVFDRQLVEEQQRLREARPSQTWTQGPEKIAVYQCSDGTVLREVVDRVEQ